jgi:hypothetical protein
MQKRRQRPSVRYKGYVAFFLAVRFGGSNQRHAAGTLQGRLGPSNDLSRAGQSSQAEGGGVRFGARNRLIYTTRAPCGYSFCCPVTVAGALAKNVGWRMVGGHEIQHFYPAGPTADYCYMWA